MNGLRRHGRVLAIYLNWRGFGFVLFEGPLSPWDWGVRETRGPGKRRRCLACISKILNRHVPDVLVIEDTSPQGTRRAHRIAEWNAEIAELAKGRGILVYAYSRDTISSAF